MKWLKRLAARFSRRSRFRCWTSAVVARINVEITEADVAIAERQKYVNDLEWLRGHRAGLIRARSVVDEMSNDNISRER